MKTRLVGLLLVFFGPVLLNGLLGCDTCNPEPYRFSIQGYKAYPRKINRQAYKPYLMDTLATNDTISYRDIELVLTGEQVRVASLYASNSGSSAWACDPAVIGVDTIKHLTVTSDHAYRTDLGAGSNLSRVLTIGEGANGQRPMAEFLSYPWVTAQPFFSLWFSQAPNQMAQHQFKITIDYGKGRVTSFVTRPVIIKP